MRPSQFFTPAAIGTLLLSSSACQGQPATVPETQPAATQPALGQSAIQSAARFPGMTIDREAGYVDLDATVVLRDGEWLELLACSPNTREHESILAVPARPSHIHLALILLGIEPGSPMRWQEVQNEETGDWEWVTHPARGPRVAVSIVTGGADDETVTPASAWINDGDGNAMPDHHWIFTGSTLETFENPDGDDMEAEAVYSADAAGNVISLVNFGDDVLVKPSDLTNQGEGSNAAWNANTDAIPPVGTAVRIRLQPAPDAEPAEGK